MKKYSILFLAFLTLFSANVFAQQSYNLRVAEIQVTDANKDDITAAIVAAGQIGVTASGTITYDPTTNTLTLDNANISNLQDDGIYIRIADLTINLIGNNSITTNYSGINSDQADFKITGSGSLTINAVIGIFHYKCNLTIENTTVTAIGDNHGISGQNGNSEILTITNSTVKATGISQGSITKIKNLILNGCFISQPIGAEFNASQKAVCLNDTKVKTEVVIEPGIAPTTYTVSGTVKAIADDSPIEGVTITYNGAGINGTTTTAADGTYSFTAIENTTYTVTPNKLGYSFEPTTATVNVVDADITGQDFVGTAVATYTVSGTVLDNENNPLAGVTISYNGGTTTTAANGTYSFTVNENTTHTVTPSLTDYSFEPITATVNVVDADVTGIDFVETATYYDLYVADVRVTDANKDDITFAINQLGETDVSASGTITYDPTTGILTLDNASITTTNVQGIKNQIANLTINLLGENTITTANYDGIYSNVNFKITGTGSLTINARYSAIYTEQCDLTIENTTVTAVGESIGICGDGNNEVLTITNSTVKATGIYGSITNINNLVLNGCFISQPDGAVFDENEKGVCYNGEIVTTEVVIEPLPYTVSGTVKAIADDSPIEGVTITYNGGGISETTTTVADGTYSFTATANTTYTVTPSKIGYTFTPTTKTVNVAHADITGIDFLGIEIPTYTVSGTVKAIADDSPIEGATITYEGGGINGTTTTVANGTYSFIANQNTTYTVTASLTGYTFAPANATVEVAEEDVTEVDFVGTIILTYDLYVADVQVTDANKNNITSAVNAAGETASGNITYDPTTNTLTLDNATLNLTNADGIYNEIENLTINLIGENTITANAGGIHSFANFTITGSGSLTINAFYGIYQNNCNLAIDNTTITSIGQLYGISGMYGISEILTITNSTVKASSTNEGSIKDINNLILNGCFISQPDAAVFDEEQRAVCLNGEIVKTEVVIEPLPYTVSGIVKAIADDSPIEGVTITYNGGGINGTTTTAADGTYSFTANENTNYTVTPSKAGYTFTPTTKTVNVTNADVTGVIFFGTADGIPVDETEINAITVYPNPANDYIKVAGLTGNEEILVFDINGRIVKTLEANDNIETISINDLAKGSYMIKVRKDNKIEVLKFIK